MLMDNWYGEMIGVKGSFLMGRFYNNEIIHLKVPEGIIKNTLQVMYFCCCVPFMG